MMVIVDLTADQFPAASNREANWGIRDRCVPFGAQQAGRSYRQRSNGQLSRAPARQEMPVRLNPNFK